jgi:lipid-A-disaccharide synthase
LLLVLPGSRHSEIRRNMEIFGETLRLLHAQGVDFEPVLPAVPDLVTSVREAAANWPVQPKIVISESEKKAAFRSARAALAKSGTVTLELALAGVPMVTAYRVTEVEAFIARRVIRTSSIILTNLILGENVIPEFLQQDFTAEKLAPALREIIEDTPARQRQIAAFARLEEIMSTGGRRPSELAADGVIAMLR